MREILFRGKRTDNGKWVQGYYTNNQWYTEEKDMHIIIYKDAYLFPYGEFEAFEIVDPATVGQYTGVNDINNVQIFEGDIVKGLFYHEEPVLAVVKFKDGAFGLAWNRSGAETFSAFTSLCNVKYEVLGNIHDNPELLEVEK